MKSAGTALVTAFAAVLFTAEPIRNHLASHILGQISRRIRQDWQAKYGQPLWLLETFVDRQSFAGTCYRAANWIFLGQTQGRGRQGPAGRLSTTIKDVYVWPLHRDFRPHLSPQPTQIR